MGCYSRWKKKFNFVNKSFKFLKNKYCILISNTSQNKEETIKDTLNKLKINQNFLIELSQRRVSGIFNFFSRKKIK